MQTTIALAEALRNNDQKNQELLSIKTKLTDL